MAVGKNLKNIVWLVSYPKSGNTWFRVFLANLLNPQDSPVNINNLNSIPNATSRSMFDIQSGTSSADLSPYEILELRPEVYRNMAEKSNELIYLKVHECWMKTSSGKSVFPEDVTKCVVYFVRNPLDVSISFAFHNGSNPLDTINLLNDHNQCLCSQPDKLYNQLSQRLSAWSSHVESWVNNSGLPIIVLRYEDMLTDPYVEFSRALSFIGIQKTEQEVLQAIKYSNFEYLALNESKEGFKEKPIQMKSFFRVGKSHQWMEHFDQKTVNRFIERNKSAMDQFNYLS